MTRIPKGVRDVRDQCKGKMGYSTKQRAKLVIRRLRSRQGDLVVYRCPHCSRFHIGNDRPTNPLPPIGD